MPDTAACSSTTRTSYPRRWSFLHDKPDRCSSSRQSIRVSHDRRLTRLTGTRRWLAAILEGKPFTPAEALALGAVDEVVSQNKVLERAMERAEYLSLRSKKSLGAIKRSVYFGSSMPLSDGLQFEHAEFLVIDQSKEAQQLMLEYIATTEATGELPLLDRKTYDRALSTGRIGSHSNELV